MTKNLFVSQDVTSGYLMYPEQRILEERFSTAADYIRKCTDELIQLEKSLEQSIVAYREYDKSKPDP